MRENDTASRAVVYLRMSSDRAGDELGIGRQREDVEALVHRRGWTLAREHVENDISASGRKRRPGFVALLEDIRAGEADVVVAWTLDRLTRNARDRLDLAEACQQAGVMLSFARGSDIDPTTPSGRLTLGILGEVAQHEIDQKSDRQKRAALQAAQQGRRVGGRRPFGYEQDGVTVRTAEAAAIRRGYSDLLDGVPLAVIAREWNDAGLHSGQTSYREETRGQRTSWDAKTVRHVLRNARNAGIRTHRGEEVGEAAWPALVDIETYRAVVAALDDPVRNTGGVGRPGRQLLTALAVCGLCGAAVHGGGATHGKPIYRCVAVAHMSRLRDPVDEFVARVAVRRLQMHGPDLLIDHNRPDVEILRAEAIALRAKLDRLAEDYNDGTLDKRHYLRFRDKSRAELADVEQRQVDAGRASVLAPFLANADPAKVWAGLDTDRRRGVVDTLMTVRLYPIGRGTRTFRPETVGIEWKTDID